ncbi:CDP-diacylglycerol--serine O-phosphatidyltransferase [Cystobacter fuscus DSM 2262]|uniref:CDP-diacylglycerol--serine O-phosphatidyltransferase n=1 Tax=Cystobacter fuscus (strain ATCC 25194 / DSM 2262 / NBRC 100088 / M29) TaxID=1242864 RepID=S9QJV6_CYSF2|nr:CDP-diacylglycerol--serine O-phosphatidyltransferase [Cystobacter fuscus]EPX61554.1 CDP-diacylglycerol--serine O-phosphatidyltransferase [Cystobacter fuscus DSM 2262]
MSPRKLMFVLPNLFTVTSILCGFYALTLCAGEAAPAQLNQAALAILFAMFFDGCDGRVARLTRTQSDFGMQLDSLADVVSFGAAPGLLVYKWALEPLGFVGLLIAFSFTACGALRLARFNVLAMRSPQGGGGNFFVGLPIPLAASVLVSMIIAHYAATGGEPLDGSARGPVVVATLSLSLLMVSTVRYRTFKDLRLSPRSAAVLALVLASGVVIGTRFHPAYVLVAYSFAYLGFGLLESAFLVRHRLVARKAGRGAAPAMVLLDEAEDEDDDEDDGQRMA